VADLRALLQNALGPLYRVEREVRPVGDCRLFVACELPAGPDLLVKVLPGALSLGMDALAFEREVLLLADRLGHPRLVAPSRAGRVGAHVYHARPFVEGTTLRALLQRQGELPLTRAVEILRDVLDALAHAHAGHLAHGDLRPEHVLLAEGRTMVVDAGMVGAIARSLTAGAPGAATAALCAPAYVAPDRVDEGDPAAPRDDMFAVGVLVHEMLTGEPPAKGGEPLERMRELPPWLTELLRRCRADAAGARWTDAAEALAGMHPPFRDPRNHPGL
jgi:serine/threonine-protein kinase